MALNATDRFIVVQPTVMLADPHVLSDIRDRRSIIDAIYDALVRRDDNGVFIPWLATEWLTDATQQEWRFHIRHNVFFHDNTRLTPDDVVASLKRAISPEMPGELGTEGVLRHYLAGANIHTLNNDWVRIQFDAPFADLLDLLVDIPVIPAALAPFSPEHPVGSGPYQFSRQEQHTLTLTAFEHHWAGRGPADTLIWVAEPDPERRLALLASQQADLVVDPPRASAAVNPGIIRQPGYLCIIYLFNLFSGPLTDIRVRKALNLAVNRQAIIDDPTIAAGEAHPLAGPLTPRHPGDHRQYTDWPWDPELARALLADAGYAQGLTLDVAIPARFPDESPALFSRIKDDLALVGITLNLTVYEDRPGYAWRVRGKEFGHLCCFDSSPASAWRVYKEKLDSRTRGPWWQGYDSDVFNARLDEIAAAASEPHRTQALDAAFRQIQEDAPWLFLYTPHHLWAPGEKARGWRPSPEGRIRII